MDVQTRYIVPQQFAGAIVLGALFHDRPEARGVHVYFKKGAGPQKTSCGYGVALDRVFTIGDAGVVHASTFLTRDHLELTLDGDPTEILLNAPETDLLAGTDCLLGLRNGETLAQARDWLGWHHNHHGMTAALILDRARPGSDNFAADLAANPVPGIDRVVILSCPLPLGADLPAEAHPYCVPGAPGKDRMDIPPADPWRAPFDNANLFEYLRHAYLERARTVTHVDLHDLIHPTEDGLSARTAREGAVLLGGRQVYPWRVADPEDVRFADHICAPFDATSLRRSWSIAPAIVGPNCVWRPNRVVGAIQHRPDPVIFDRHMGIRHDARAIAKIVPKSSLIEDPGLLERATQEWHHSPERMPKVDLDPLPEGPTKVVIVTCMKNEGPFILEWLAYHRAIGVTDVIVYTNDCDDGTDTFLDLLQTKGILQHRDNPFRATGQKPQHAALAASDHEDVVKNAHWAISMDVDEFINVKTGDGTLRALFEALPDANLISCTWRLFGNSHIHDYDHDELLIRDYTRCAPEFANKPHQAWGFKTLFKRQGFFRKMGVHRPKGLNPQLWNKIHWVNGSGVPLPRDMYRNAWRSTAATYGYDMVQLNHYAVRSAESFLVKRDRGRVNHVDRDQGLAYWFRMNNNGVEDHSIQDKLPMMLAERDRLLADPEIRAQHEACVAAHRAKINTLRARPDQQEFFATLTGDRMQRLSQMHKHFGSNIFLGGPDTVPDEVVFADHEDDFFFTVDDIGETQH